MLFNVRVLAIVLVGLAALSSAAFSAETATYVYDSQGRLSEIIYPSGERVVYTYDLSGNVTAQTIGTGPPPSDVQLTLDVSHTPSAIGDGDTISYQIDLSNAGAPAVGFQLDVVSEPLQTIVSAATNDGTCTVSETVVCDLDTITPSTPVSVSVVVSAGSVGTVTLNAEASGFDTSGAPYTKASAYDHTVEPPTGPVVPLTLGSMASVQYGNSYGTNEHGTIVIAQFEADATSDLEIGVVGYDIDYTDEVKVVLNGADIGYLKKGPNNANSALNIIAIPSLSQVNGTNEIRFIQNRVPTYKWGVTNIELQPAGTLFDADVALTFDVLDTGQYGKGYGPVNHGRDLTVGFLHAGGDVVLEVTGYDIDFVDELSVSVNGVFHSYLSTGPNNGLNSGDQIAIPASSLVTGANEVLFYNKNASWIWGGTNL